MRVFVRDVRVIGNTAFSDTEIAAVRAPFKNRTLLTEDLEQLRLALTLLYVNKGSLTSGAIIPDQDVTSGVITVQIIEGRLTWIDVAGTRWFRSSYLRNRLELGIRTSVTLDPLQEQLQLFLSVAHNFGAKGHLPAGSVSKIFPRSAQMKSRTDEGSGSNKIRRRDL